VIPHDSAGSGAPRPLARVSPDVDLWWCELDVDAATLAQRTALLAPAEHARAARFGTDMLRSRWIAGRGALRIVLGSLLGAAPADVGVRRGRRGRPELVDAAFDFNVSHTNGVAVIGVARRGRIGIDVERSDRTVGADRLSKKFLAAAERAALGEMRVDERRERFLRYWTCKEAMSKATGDGLIAPFARMHVDIDHIELLDGPAPYSPASWALHSVPAPAPYLVTVAIWHAPSPHAAAAPQ
jgi:4'-phosphopantetheinyl transferase